MIFIYNLIIYIVSALLKVVALFNKKIKLFVAGRKVSFQKLNTLHNTTDKVIWIHCASLGEFEQGRPIIEKLKKNHPSKKIVLTFFLHRVMKFEKIIT